MKKLLAILLVFAMCLGLCACKSCEHQYAEAITKEATCTEVGEKTFTCSLCNESYTEEIPVIPHSFGEATITKEATCTAEGEKSVTCTVCGYSEVQETVPMTEHTFGEPVITKAPTCTEAGEQTGSCTVCQETTTSEVSATGHNYEEKTTKSAGCTTDGTKTITCKNCGDSSTEAIKAYGHNWQSASCTTPKTCSNCGLTGGEALGHSYSNGACVRCGLKSYKISVDPLPTVRSYIAAGSTVSQISISNCTYDITESGTLSITIGYTKTYSYNDDKAYPAIGFNVVLLDSNRNVVNFAKYYTSVYKKYIYVGQYDTVSLTYTGLEPGEYIIAFTNYDS